LQMVGSVRPIKQVELTSLSLNLVKGVGFQGSATGRFLSMQVQVSRKMLPLGLPAVAAVDGQCVRQVLQSYAL
jgi:hypothetical protein